jgi:hypothetical protein
MPLPPNPYLTAEHIGLLDCYWPDPREQAVRLTAPPAGDHVPVIRVMASTTAARSICPPIDRFRYNVRHQAG